MKKALIFLVVFFVFSGGAAPAQELGNPAKLIKQGQFDVGFQWSYMFKQEFEDYNLKKTYPDGTTKSSPKRADFEDDQYYMGTVTYGIIDRINVFARLGMVNGGKFQEYEAGSDWTADLESNFVWALGAKGKIYEFDNGLGFGLAAQYMRYDNREVKNWQSGETGRTAADIGWATDNKIDYWQLDVVANAYWILGAFTPYAGAGYSYSQVDFGGRWTHEDPAEGWVDSDASFSNEYKFTALVGMDVDLGKNFKVNVQGTFVSRTALTLGISYCF